MSDTLQVLKSRRACRTFSDKLVDRETLDQIVEAGRFAPSGMGRQAAELVVIQDAATVAQLSRMNAEIAGRTGDPFYGAPTVIVVLADSSVPTHVEDGSLVMGNLMNAAAALGVDSIWVHRAKQEFESDEGKALLAAWGLPADGRLRGVGHCCLGYTEKPLPEAKPRRDNVTYVL